MSQTRRPPGLFRSAAILFGKDLLLEWRTRARTNALVFFALATLLLFSFALGPDPLALRRNASGYLWLGVLFASTLSLGESFRVEAENGALDGLLLLPTDPRALFLGKAVGNAVLLFSLSCLLLPVMVGLFNVRVPMGFGAFAGVAALGCLSISAPGTLYSAIANQARARDVLLPLLLFPILIPALLAAVKATALVLEGDPMGQLGSWLGLSASFNLVYWGLGFLLFPRVVEDP
jgi:heme exporter protein B